MWIIPLHFVDINSVIVYTGLAEASKGEERTFKFINYFLFPEKAWSIKYSEPDLFLFGQITALVERPTRTI